MKERIANILKEYTKKNGIMASCVILEDYAEELVKQGVVMPIRCKDCKKFVKKGEEFLTNDVYGNCEKSRVGFFDEGKEVYGNDFCSYGELKELK